MMQTITPQNNNSYDQDLNLELIQHRDWGGLGYTYFWVVNGVVVSSYFSSEADAKNWLNASGEYYQKSRQIP